MKKIIFCMLLLMLSSNAKADWRWNDADWTPYGHAAMYAGFGAGMEVMMRDLPMTDTERYWTSVGICLIPGTFKEAVIDLHGSYNDQIGNTVGCLLGPYISQHGIHIVDEKISYSWSW